MEHISYYWDKALNCKTLTELYNRMDEMPSNTGEWYITGTTDDAKLVNRYWDESALEWDEREEYLDDIDFQLPRETELNLDDFLSDNEDECDCEYLYSDIDDELFSEYGTPVVSFGYRVDYDNRKIMCSNIVWNIEY